MKNNNAWFYRFLLIFWNLFLAVFLLTNPGQTEPAPKIQTRLIVDENPSMTQKPFWLGVDFQIEKGWHIYWQNPGDSGLATSIHWTLPEGFQIQDIQWPTPKRFQSKDAISYGYENQVLLFSRATPPKNFNPKESYPLKAQVKWLACKDACIPGEATVQINLPASSAAVQKERFQKFQQDVPRVFPQWKFSAKTQKDQIWIALKPPKNFKEKISELHFFPIDEELIDHNAEQKFETKGDEILLHLKISEFAKKPLKNLNGVLVSSTLWEKHQKEKAMAIDVPIQNEAEK